LKAHIFKGFLNKIKLWWYELENGKMCELQDHLNVFSQKSLDLDCKNELSSALFG
jgi:hypothetical protein